MWFITCPVLISPSFSNHDGNFKVFSYTIAYEKKWYHNVLNSRNLAKKKFYWTLMKTFLKSPYLKCSFDSDPLSNGQIIAILLEWTVKNHGRHNNQSQHIAIPEKPCSRNMLHGLFNAKKGISHFSYKKLCTK